MLVAFSPPQIDDISDTDRSNIFFINWGCGHNLGLKYILEGQLIMSGFPKCYLYFAQIKVIMILQEL